MYGTKDSDTLQEGKIERYQKKQEKAMRGFQDGLRELADSGIKLLRKEIEVLGGQDMSTSHL
jgi:hypothetical protein